MSILSNFTNMFGTGATHAAPAPTTAAGQPGNIPTPTAPTTVATPNTAPNGAIPNNEVTNPTTPTNPLDKFKDLWEAPKDQKPPEQLFNIDNAKLMEAAGRVDFSKAVTPEIMAAIAAGGEGGVKASMEAMSKMAQLTYAQSALATTQIVEQAIKKTQDQFQAKLPDIIKNYQISDNLKTDNPAFNHPAAQPIIQALQSNLSIKHPNATTQEIKQLVNEYFTSFSQAITKPITAESKTSNEMDWTKFLE